MQNFGVCYFGARDVYQFALTCESAFQVAKPYIEDNFPYVNPNTAEHKVFKPRMAILRSNTHFFREKHDKRFNSKLMTELMPDSVTVVYLDNHCVYIPGARSGTAKPITEIRPDTAPVPRQPPLSCFGRKAPLHQITLPPSVGVVTVSGRFGKAMRSLPASVKHIIIFGWFNELGKSVVESIAGCPLLESVTIRNAVKNEHVRSIVRALPPSCKSVILEGRNDEYAPSYDFPDTVHHLSVRSDRLWLAELPTTARTVDIVCSGVCDVFNTYPVKVFPLVHTLRLDLFKINENWGGTNWAAVFPNVKTFIIAGHRISCRAKRTFPPSVASIEFTIARGLIPYYARFSIRDLLMPAKKFAVDDPKADGVSSDARQETASFIKSLDSFLYKNNMHFEVGAHASGGIVKIVVSISHPVKEHAL